MTTAEHKQTLWGGVEDTGELIFFLIEWLERRKKQEQLNYKLG